MDVKPESRCRVVIFLGAVPGSGSTTLVLNSAVTAGKLYSTRTCIVDLAEPRGDILVRSGFDINSGPIAQVPPSHSWEYLRNIQDHLRICSPPIDILSVVRASGFKECLAPLRDHYALVLIDATGINVDHLIDLAFNSDLLVLVVSDDVARVRHAGILLDDVKAHPIVAAKTILVTNETMPSDTRISHKHIDQFFGDRATHRISFCRRIGAHSNAGIPYLVEDEASGSRYSCEVANLVSTLLSTTPRPPPSGGRGPQANIVAIGSGRPRK